STINNRYARTGQAAIPLSKMAKRAADEKNNTDKKPVNLDLDTDLHRQAYSTLNLNESAALQDKFTPKHLLSADGEPRKVYYPIDLDKDFQYSSPYAKKRSQKEAIKDMALIHIDGNGLGLLLRALQSALKDKKNQDYCHAFRQFSQALTTATQLAAQTATNWLYENAAYQLPNSQNNKTYLPMRPLVLGGDDVTLLCRADLALEYSRIFCQAFKIESEQALKEIHKRYQLAKEGVKPYLTASGGILYHKASHPFTHSHHLVEDLCAKAKKLTKSVDNSVKEKTAPAALAFFRLSNSVSSDIETLCQQTQQFDVQSFDEQNKVAQRTINLGLNAYLVDGEQHTPHHQQLEHLHNCINASTDKTVSMTKWRQMATELALGNKIEADRLYDRAIDISTKKEGSKEQRQAQHQALEKIASSELTKWYWQIEQEPEKNQGQGNNTLQTIITDMLIVDHFSPVLNSSEPNKPEQIPQENKEQS
nr:hypothetical protein [Pseudoalteromonas sp.]